MQSVDPDDCPMAFEVSESANEQVSLELARELRQYHIDVNDLRVRQRLHEEEAQRIIAEIARMRSFCDRLEFHRIEDPSRKTL